MYQMVVIGFSAGGLPLVSELLHGLPKQYPLPIALVLHLPAGYDSQVNQLIQKHTELKVAYACDKQEVRAGSVYIAPPDYHLLVEQCPDRQKVCFALSVDDPVAAVRPSIDVLFSSAAEVYESALIAVLLSGANSDGIEGMNYVKQLGGLTMVLNPDDCEFNLMPRTAIEKVDVDYVVGINEMLSLLSAVEIRS